jgi:putative membrane protein
MKNYISGVLFLAIILALGSCGKKNDAYREDDKDSKDVAEDRNEEKFDSTSIEGDTEFAVEAADGGLLEVRLGELAQANAASEKVKELGRMMVTDHSVANDELRNLAAQKNISLPATLGDKKQKIFDKLSAKKGEEFDEAYTDLMVDDHKKDIRKFMDEAERGKDPELRTWASNKVPTLQHHLSVSEKTKDEVKKSSKN